MNDQCCGSAAAILAKPRGWAFSSAVADNSSVCKHRSTYPLFPFPFSLPRMGLILLSKQSEGQARYLTYTLMLTADAECRRIRVGSQGHAFLFSTPLALSIIRCTLPQEARCLIGRLPAANVPFPCPHAHARALLTPACPYYHNTSEHLTLPPHPPSSPQRFA